MYFFYHSLLNWNITVIYICILYLSSILGFSKKRVYSPFDMPADRDTKPCITFSNFSFDTGYSLAYSQIYLANFEHLLGQSIGLVAGSMRVNTMSSSVKKTRKQDCSTVYDKCHHKVVWLQERQSGKWPLFLLFSDMPTLRSFHSLKWKATFHRVPVTSSVIQNSPRYSIVLAKCVGHSPWQRGFNRGQRAKLLQPGDVHFREEG